MNNESMFSSLVEVPDAVRGGPRLSPGTLRTVRAIAEVLFATARGPAPSEAIEWLVSDLDDFFAHAGGRARLSFWLCVTAISIVAPLFIRRLAPLRSLSLGERAEAIERMERSPIALPFFGAKAVLCIVYYEHPDSAKSVGFDGACMKDPP